MPFLRSLRRLLILALAGTTALALLLVYALPRFSPADLPWTPLDLAAPLGTATGGKLAALDGSACRLLLTQAAIPYRRRAVIGHGACGLADGVTLAAAPGAAIRYFPSAPPLACPLAAALVMWEREVVDPAASRDLGTSVIGIDHLGTYSCRRLYGRATGDWSEHAAARAIDVAAFRLADGRRISVARDWRGKMAAGRFLHDVRDGACRLFATTLSPDYNAAHRTHFHLDEAARGRMWRVCR